MSIRLIDLSVGQSAHVVALAAQPAFATMDALVDVRLQELGFVVGAKVVILSRAPFAKEPIAVRIGQSKFALRRAEAEKLVVEPD